MSKQRMRTKKRTRLKRRKRLNWYDQNDRFGIMIPVDRGLLPEFKSAIETLLDTVDDAFKGAKVFFHKDGSFIAENIRKTKDLTDVAQWFSKLHHCDVSLMYTKSDGEIVGFLFQKGMGLPLRTKIVDGTIIQWHPAQEEPEDKTVRSWKKKKNRRSVSFHTREEDDPQRKDYNPLLLCFRLGDPELNPVFKNLIERRLGMKLEGENLWIHFDTGAAYGHLLYSNDDFTFSVEGSVSSILRIVEEFSFSCDVLVRGAKPDGAGLLGLYRNGKLQEDPLSSSSPYLSAPKAEA